MHILTFLSPAILGAALASAQWYSASTTYELSLSCSTAYGPTWVHPIPTDYSRFSTTISSSYPLATQLDTVYVTADTTATVPTTSYFYETTIYTVRQDRTTTYTHVIPSTATIATITNPTTVCTNDVTPTATVTSYTGTPYTPIPGQNTVLPSTWEDSIFCNVYDIAIEHIWPTVQGTGQTTTTITPSVTDRNSVVRTTITYIWKTSIPVATTVITARSYDVAYTSPTISTACVPQPTVTLAEQCRPENFIGELDGYGLDIRVFHPNFTFGGVYNMQPQDTDPSRCCQLCVDTEGCVAMTYFAMAPSCLLGFLLARPERAATKSKRGR